VPALQALLDAAPVWMLQAGREHAAALQGMGLHTLGELLALPRDGLARRFGEGLLDQIDRALGLQPDPRRFAVLPAVFESRLELHTRAENTDQVLHGAAVLLARLVAWAQAQHARVGAFTLRMLHERQRQATAPPTELHVALAEPALDAAHLQSLLRERLGRCQLAEPTLELRLHCQHLVAGHAPNGELFPTRASADEGLTRLLERLRARLGDAQVQRLQPVADHRPERATRSVPAQGGAAPATGAAVDIAAVLHTGATSSLPLHRPAWLLPEPLPLAMRDTQPLLQGRPLQLVSGPERIEAGWWDGAPVARDYFIALAEDGRLVWLYRSRLPTVPGEVTWFLQGLFA
jgi:protein ImuB